MQAKSSVGENAVDEYPAGAREPARSTLNMVRARIRSAVPPAATKAISYRIPTFKYKGPLLGSPRFLPAALVKKPVKARIAENEQKKRR